MAPTLRKSLPARARCAVLVLLALITMSGAVPGVCAADSEPGEAINPKHLYFPINNMNVPVLQGGRTRGMLLFNFLVELTSPDHRPYVAGFAPKLKSRFFDELYVYASTLKESDKVKLTEIKSMLTEIAHEIAGEDKVKAVLVKDIRRAFSQ